MGDNQSTWADIAWWRLGKNATCYHVTCGHSRRNITLWPNRLTTTDYTCCFPPVSSLQAKLGSQSPGSSFIFNRQTWEWYWSYHLTPGKKANRCISQNVKTIPLRDVYLLFSLWHLARALHRLGSGHRSRGDWPFLLRMVRSAPLAARKQAMDAALFFSAPWVPKPMINCR